MPGKDQLVEATARAIAGCTFKPSTVDLIFSDDEDMALIRDAKLDEARAAVDVVLDAAMSELKGMKQEGRMGSIGFERNSAINECLAALVSLGKEGEGQ